jgi:hypothetical protein
MQFISIGKKAAIEIATILEASPIPKMIMIKGKMAILGIGWIAAMRGSMIWRKRGDHPMANPSSKPAVPPMAKPITNRPTVATICIASFPFKIIWMSEPTIVDGAGKKSADNWPVLENPSQSISPSPMIIIGNQDSTRLQKFWLFIIRLGFPVLSALRLPTCSRFAI